MTVFIVLGLVLLAVVIMAISLRMSLVEDRVGDLEEQVELSTQRTALNLMVDGCLRTKAVQAIELYGVDESAEQLITNFIEYEIIPCIDVSPFTNEGIRVYNDEGYVTTEISDNAVAVEMHLPLTLLKEDSRATLDDFAFTLQKVRHVSLPTDSDGRMQETYSFTTPNNRAEITIPENTVVKRDNAAVDSEDMIALRLVDRNYNNMQNSISIGEIMYLMESGITFSPAATMTIYYNEDELPPWEKEEELTLSIYNEDRGIWEVLPSTVEADKDRIIAEIDHFSLFSVTSSICSDIEGNRQVIASGLIFKERCGPCDNPAWKTKGDGEGKKIYSTSDEIEKYDYSELNLGEPKGECIEKSWEKETTTLKSVSTEAGCIDENGNWDADANEGAGECTKETDAPEQWGYEDVEHVGGTATFTFEVESGGNTCENENTVDVNISFISSDNDPETGEGGTANHLLNGADVNEGNFIGGTNTITFDVVNANEDACADAEVEITVYGAGFLPACGVGEITGNCHCGKQNVIKGDKTLFCCESEVVVEGDPGKCDPVNAAAFACPNGFLSMADNGCYCNGQADWHYDHYGGHVHYCCGSKGLSAAACDNFCETGEIAGPDGCICRGGHEATAGQVCCVIDSEIIYPLHPDDCPDDRVVGACPSTDDIPVVSAAIMDITGRTIQASELCAVTVGDAGGFTEWLGKTFCPKASFDDDGKPIPYTQHIICDWVVLNTLSPIPGFEVKFINCAKEYGYDFDGDGVREFNAKECFKALLAESKGESA